MRSLCQQVLSRSTHSTQLEEVYVLLKHVRNIASHMGVWLVYSAPRYYQHLSAASGSWVNKSNDKNPAIRMKYRVNEFLTQNARGRLKFARCESPVVRCLAFAGRRRIVSTSVRSEKLMLDRGRDGSS